MAKENPWKGWWRWFLIPISIVLAHILLGLAGEAYLWLQNFLFPKAYSPFIQSISSAAIYSMVIVAAASYTAPKYRMIVGIISLTTLVIFILIGTIHIYINFDQFSSKYIANTILQFIATLIGGIVVIKEQD